MSEQQIEYFRRTDLAADVNVALARILEQKPPNPRTVLAGILARPKVAPTIAQIYATYVSANSMCVVAGAACMGINYELKPIDMMKGEHKSADFLAVNPNGQVPALHIPDLGIRMGESAAILRTLANAFPVADHWYSINPALRFRVDWALDWRQTTLYPKLAPWTYYCVGFAPDVVESVAKKPQAVETMNHFLQAFVGEKFAAGDDVSIADLSICSMLHLCRADPTFTMPAEWEAYWNRVKQAAGVEVYNEVYQVLDDFVAAARQRNEANASFMKVEDAAAGNAAPADPSSVPAEGAGDAPAE
eukprot:TRINITY_DN15803_c0_g1_i1.p1 TRINITY_DN15803_c0_g1~~TRINITY_DN15803_c0_g1_i1.p1  ORF type:complete len:303 (-),score=57.86 TRINITY_DN15803_c0_g1_i1:179-1087(-)